MKGRTLSRVPEATGVCLALLFFVGIDAFAQSQGNNRGVIFSAQKTEISEAPSDKDALQALRLRQAIESGNKEWLAGGQEAAPSLEAVAALKAALSLKEKELDISGQAFETTAKQMDDIRFELELKNKALMASYKAAEQSKKDLELFKKAQRQKSEALKLREQKKYSATSSASGGKTLADAFLSEASSEAKSGLDSRKRDLSAKIREAEKLKREAANLKVSLEAKNRELQDLKRDKRKLDRDLINLQRANKRKEAVEKEKEALARDNHKLREEKVGLKVELLKLKASGGKEKEVTALKQERDRMQNRIVSLQEDAKKEKAKMHLDLGTAYTQARIFDLAIEEYEKSLQFDPLNAQVHYNLGLLYAHAKNDSKKSILHFKKYLEYNPTADNREEVQYLMKVIQR